MTWMSKICLLCLLGIASSCSFDYRSSRQLREDNLELDRDRWETAYRVPSGPLSLEDVITLGLTQNMDGMIRQRQLAIQEELEYGTRLALLPRLDVAGNIDHRNNLSASSSISFITGTQSLEPSYSSETTTRFRNFEAAWDLLEFGVGFYRHLQEQDRTRALRQEHRRLQQNLVLQITESYWKTVVAQRAADAGQALLSLSERHQRNLEKRIEQKIDEPLEGLQNQKRLLEIQMTLEEYKKNIAAAKAELASLIGLPPGVGFELEQPDYERPPLQLPSVENLEEQALRSRPELLGQDLEERIMVNEVHATMVAMLPGVTLFGGHNHDPNIYLVFNNWWNMGVRATWDLLSLPRKNQDVRTAKFQLELAQETRMALSVGVLSQVHIAYLEYQAAVKKYEMARDLYNSKQKIFELGRRGQGVGEFDEADILQLASEALIADIFASTAYAERSVALEKLSNAVGRPLAYSEMILEQDVVAQADPETQMGFAQRVLEGIWTEPRMRGTPASAVDMHPETEE